jgi:Protein of unknown function (DUF3592)
VPDVPWFVYAMLLAPLGLVLVVAAWKTWQARAASKWPSTPGKVVISNSEVRDVTVMDSDREDGRKVEQRNFANIVYEYSVAGKKLRNNRVSIGEDLGNFQVAETIAKYPTGHIVMVYYNPLHPNEAVLERDLPKGMWGCLGIGTAIVLAIVFGSAIGLHRLTEFVSARLADPKVSALVVALGAFGLVVALFALALQRQASLARKWPVVPGTIKTSGLEQFVAAASEPGERRQLMFQSKVLFAYRFNNIDYVSQQASLGGKVSSTSSALVRGFAKKYPDGASVQVHVNPDNPSEAVLEPRANGAWIIWVAVAIIWGLAYFIATRG